MPEPTPLFMWPSDMGACRYYRSQLPAEALVAHDGRSAEVAGYGPRWFGRPIITLPDEVRDEPDRLVVLQRSYNVTARRTVTKFSEAGRPWMFDIDDHLFAVEPDNPAAGIYHRADIRANLEWMVANTTAMTVSTEPLAEALSAFTDRPIFVAHNALAADKLADLPDDVGDRHPTIFWRGSATHDRDVDVMRYALSRVEKHHPEVRIVLAGQDYRRRLRLRNAVMLDDLLWDNPEWRARITDGHWSKLGPSDSGGIRRIVHMPTDIYLDAVREVVQPTIVVCPLRSSAFNDCKSHIAALEGHAAGGYVIASRMPAYDWYLAREGGTSGHGELVRWNEQDWWRAISDALDMDAAERRGWARTGLERARATSVEQLAPTYAELFDGVGVAREAEPTPG